MRTCFPGLQAAEMGAEGSGRPDTTHLITAPGTYALWQQKASPGRIYDLKINSLISPLVLHPSNATLVTHQMDVAAHLPRVPYQLLK